MKKTIFTLALCQMISATTFAAEVTTVPDNTSLTIGDMNSKGKTASDWEKRTDISLQFQNDFKPIYSIETVNPIAKITKKVTNFYDFRISTDLTAGTIANFGLGNRVLSNDKKSMFGENIYYDYGFKYNHERIGGGLEYFRGRNEYRANIYHGLSGDNLIDPSIGRWEHVLDGYDYEMGTSLVGAPWLKVFAQGYHWDYISTTDADGYKLRTTLQLTPRVNFELGYLHDNVNGGDKYVKVMYNLADSAAISWFGSNGKKNTNTTDQTVESKRLQKIVRDNEINRVATTKIAPIITPLPN